MRPFFQTLELFRDCFSRRWNILCALLVLAGPALAQTRLNEREQEHLRQALRAMNLTEADLGFTKDVAEPRQALGWVRAALHDPFALNRAAGELWDAARDGEAGPLWVAAGALLELGRTPEAAATAPSTGDTWEGLDPQLAEALSRFMQDARRANGLLDQAFGGLQRSDLSYLAASALGGLFHADREEASWRALADAGLDTNDLAAVLADERNLDATPGATNFLARAERVDRAALVEAGHVFQHAVAELARAAAAINRWPDGNVVLVTDLGKVRIASVSDDSYSDKALLILEPGGRNTYQGMAGVANALRDQRLSAIIDLGGDDTYRADGLLGAGAALFGVAVVVDAHGSDTWRSPYVGQGAGLFGCAWLDDGEGDDDYAARALSQGAALLGVGALVDRAGNDVYDVGLEGQAFAGLWGLGVLVDRAGNDRYLAGGREPDHERNQDRYLSLAQGFAIGMRPFAGGGVAALMDLAGNDTYVADVYGQGVSYYYSAGLLMDGAGNDTYAVYQYGQGAGIHLSHGLLADLSGNDVYSGGILVQGAGHDFGVGGLIDRGGRDSYIADHDAQGHGMNSALGWLMDDEGDDVYVARDPSTAQGVGNTGGEREAGSLGLLLDLGGRDAYSCPARNGEQLLRPLYGIVYDIGEGGP